VLWHSPGLGVFVNGSVFLTDSNVTANTGGCAPPYLTRQVYPPSLFTTGHHAALLWRAFGLWLSGS
jgi:hypothetical protein